MTEKIYCDNGHLIGEMSDAELFIQHHKRKVSILRAMREPITVIIECDRCSQKKAVVLSSSQNTTYSGSES